MPDPEQLEKAVVAIAEQFEKFSNQFAGAFIHISELERGAPQKWYTPKKIFLRLLRTGAIGFSGMPEAVALCAIAHGAIDTLGFSGTVKLVLELRRKHAKGKH